MQQTQTPVLNVRPATLQSRLKSCSGFTELDIREQAEKNAPPRHYANPAKNLLDAHNARQPDPQLSSHSVALPWIDLPHFVQGTTDLDFYHGEEHDVWRDPETHRAVKKTKPLVMKIGQIAYLERLAKLNEVFADDIKVEGVIKDADGSQQIITSQPWVNGRPSTSAEIDDMMRRKGFLKAMDGLWYREQDDLWVGDVYNDPVPVEGKQRRNVLTDARGNVSVIDATLPTLSERQAERFQEYIQAQPQPTPPPLPLPERVKFSMP